MEPSALLLAGASVVVPAYLANCTPPIFGGGRPLDLGRNFLDGRRLLGEGKTIRGTVAGVTWGLLGAWTMFGIAGFDPRYLAGGSMAALGAVAGDAFGAFVKRRLGMPRGAMAPGLDQLSFILFALLFAYPFVAIPAPIMLAIIAITAPAHLIANFVAYKLGWKKEPW